MVDSMPQITPALRFRPMSPFISALAAAAARRLEQGLLQPMTTPDGRPVPHVTAASEDDGPRSAPRLDRRI